VIAQKLLIFIDPLLKAGQDYQEISEDDFNEEQISVSRLVHLIKSDPETNWRILNMFFE
jgi:hypothetical protein